MNLRDCPLAAGAAPHGCDWCGRLLTGRQKRWCGNECEWRYRVNHVWTYARAAAHRRDGGRCVECGSGHDVEVHHDPPLAGRPRTVSCAHHLDRLTTLCHEHHVERHQQRPSGMSG